MTYDATHIAIDFGGENELSQWPDCPLWERRSILAVAASSLDAQDFNQPVVKMLVVHRGERDVVVQVSLRRLQNIVRTLTAHFGVQA